MRRNLSIERSPQIIVLILCYKFSKTINLYLIYRFTGERPSIRFYN
ncbi:MAG: hypothetical protein K0S45_3205 [Nitrospira sp.]|jgi:hypothetical protein|nr:hypothetical protein [Nitrospira sp.]